MTSSKRKKGLFSLLGITLCCLMPLSSCSGNSSLSSSTPSTSSDSSISSSSSSTHDSSTGGKDDVPSGTTVQESEITPEGTTSGYTENKGKFFSDYKTLDDAHEAGKDLNIQLAEEGDVLLKNENNALPLDRYEKNVTLLGIKSVDIQTGGGGSGAGMPGGYGVPLATLPKAMEDAGFKVNQKVLDFYSEHISEMSYTIEAAGSAQTLTVELPLSYYDASITSTYSSYNDAAIITISRTGAEGVDLVMHDVPGHANKADHVLMLSDAEKDLIKHAKQNFKKVIVLLNSSNIMEVGELNEPKTESNLGVDAILWIGHTGNDGAVAIPSILTGEVNPSGHTVDLWSRDFKKDPSWSNFGDNVQNGLDNYMYGPDGKDTGFRSVEYREDIYNGYRYYETVAHDMGGQKGEDWYQENVVYPFGYGLSYTTFDWKITDDIARKATIDKANETVTMKVEVTNTGDVEGKDVVQVYASTPYYEGGIEKADPILMGFAKTDILKPGESQIVNIVFAAQDMASFDYDDSNFNDFYGYELEHGDYTISVRKDSHTVVDSVTRTIESDITCPKDLGTGKEITPVFSQTDGIYANYNSTNDALNANLLSRSGDMTVLPKSSSKEDRTKTQGWVDMMEGRKTYEPYQDLEDDPWYVSEVPSTWTQATAHEKDYSDVTTKIWDMSGVSYTDPTIVDGKLVASNDEDTKKWDAFLNQMTWEELCQVSSQGAYGRPAVDSIGKPFETDIDGPAQMAWYGNVQVNNYYPTSDKSEWPVGLGTLWVTAVVVASTWNKDLAEEQGLMVGNESILTNSPGWYGPSLNTHRSPLGGRNFEYYSEDPLVSGVMAAAVVDGATSKGVVCYSKHMFLNEQETNRDTKRGLCTYATEQAIREIYLKPFEYVIKKGRSLGTMAASNRIGDYVAFGNYALQVGILRNEWDFKGANETDSCGGGTLDYSSMNQMLRNGIDYPLGIGSAYEGSPTYASEDTNPGFLEKGRWNAQENMVYVPSSATDTTYSLASPTQYYVVRKAAMHALYVSANSNGINNGINNVSSSTINIKPFEEVNQSIVNLDEINATSLSDVKATGDLPKGLSLSSTGVLSGMAAEAGSFTISVTFKADGWVKKSMTLIINVENNVIQYSGTNLSSVAAGSAINGAFETSRYKVGETLTTNMGGYSISGPITNVTYAGENLPEWLTLNSDGTLVASSAVSGTYQIHVTVTAAAMGSLYGMSIPISESFSAVFTIVVA